MEFGYFFYFFPLNAGDIFHVISRCEWGIMVAVGAFGDEGMDLLSRANEDDWN